MKIICSSVGSKPIRNFFKCNSVETVTFYTVWREMKKFVELILMNIIFFSVISNPIRYFFKCNSVEAVTFYYLRLEAHITIPMANTNKLLLNGVCVGGGGCVWLVAGVHGWDFV